MYDIILKQGENVLKFKEHLFPENLKILGYKAQRLTKIKISNLSNILKSMFNTTFMKKKEFCNLWAISLQGLK